MKEMTVLTLAAVEYEIVDAAARASLLNKADKSEIANAGKVKTVNNIQPDDSGNITITIPDPDMSAYASKKDVTDLTTSINNLVKEVLA